MQGSHEVRSHTAALPNRVTGGVKFVQIYAGTRAPAKAKTALGTSRSFCRVFPLFFDAQSCPKSESSHYRTLCVAVKRGIQRHSMSRSNRARGRECRVRDHAVKQHPCVGLGDGERGTTTLKSGRAIDSQPFNAAQQHSKTPIRGNMTLYPLSLPPGASVSTMRAKQDEKLV